MLFKYRIIYPTCQVRSRQDRGGDCRGGRREGGRKEGSVDECTHFFPFFVVYSLSLFNDEWHFQDPFLYLYLKSVDIVYIMTIKVQLIKDL